MPHYTGRVGHSSEMLLCLSVTMVTISMAAGVGGVVVMECGVDKHLSVLRVSKCKAQKCHHSNKVLLSLHIKHYIP